MISTYYDYFYKGSVKKWTVFPRTQSWETPAWFAKSRDVVSKHRFPGEWQNGTCGHQLENSILKHRRKQGTSFHVICMQCSPQLWSLFSSPVPKVKMEGRKLIRCRKDQHYDRSLQHLLLEQQLVMLRKRGYKGQTAKQDYNSELF